MNPTLTEPREPWVVFTRADDPWVPAEATALREAGGTVVRLDGHELADPARLMDAFARELSFPGYFGRNWDALADCLHDWHSHHGGTDDRAVLIEHADVLLHAEHLGVLVAVLCQAAWQSNLRIDADGYLDVEYHDRSALHFVLLLDETAPEAFAGPATTRGDVRVDLAEGRLTATNTGPDWPAAPLDR
jgi:hypothetical protein